MSWHNAIMYDLDPHVAEIFDQLETGSADIALLQKLIGRQAKPLRILEPFCGTGRMLIPLACDGHTVIGLDQARGMLMRAQGKISQLPVEVQERVMLILSDVVLQEWPQGFDVVVLAGNCLYELATPDEQEKCIRHAAAALNPGGYLFVDNTHMEGSLDESWQRPGVRPGFPSGICTDSTRVETTTEVIWYDVMLRLVHFRRNTRLIYPDGQVIEQEYIQQKHPISVEEVQKWLSMYDFEIKGFYGDRKGQPFTKDSDRAIFWAQLAV